MRRNGAPSRTTTTQAEAKRIFIRKEGRTCRRIASYTAEEEGFTEFRLQSIASPVRLHRLVPSAGTPFGKSWQG